MMLLCFFNTSRAEVIAEGISIIPITDSVQNNGEDRHNHPKSSKSVNAGAIKLRLRLSSIFHRERNERGFFSDEPSGAGTRGITH